MTEVGTEAGAVAAPHNGLDQDLDQDLGWLLGQVQHGYLAAALAAIGDLPGGMKGLYVLRTAAGEDARNQIELARQFGIDRTVMVRLVDELERARLVERRCDPADRRARIIVATEHGVSTHEAIRERLAMVADHVLTPLAPAERATFADLLRRIATHLISIDPTHGEAACNAVREQFLSQEPCGDADDTTRPSA